MSILRPLRPLAVGLSAITVGVLTACGSGGGGTLAESSASPSVSSTPAASASASASASATASASAGTGTTTGTGTIGTGTTNTGTGGGGGPTLDVSVTTQPRCAQGTNNFMTPGQAGAVSWKATGVTNVTISVDGPGIYGTYGLTGTQEFAFGCSGAEGSTETHTYTFNTIPAGITRTITMSATVHVITTGLGNGAPPTNAPVTPTPSM
jgi:hypothetical protein